MLPETAPFSPAQRAWLSGFFAGLLNARQQAGGAMPAGAAMSPVAEPVEEEEPWHDPGLALDERLKLAGDKAPARKMMAAMAQLDCGACGYLCKTYSEAIATGAEKDLTRCTPGGRDTSKKLKELVVLYPPGAETAPAATPTAVARVVKAEGKVEHGRDNPFPARLVKCETLNKEGSSKDTRLVVLDLKNSDLNYKVGDALGICPENCPDLVQQMLEQLDASGAEDVPGLSDTHASLRDALLRERNITRPTPGLLEALAAAATIDVDRDALKAMIDDEDGTLLGGLQVIDLLERFPSARPAAADFIGALPPLQPRLYSISSSLAAHPNQVHLTVGVVKYNNEADRACKGVASTYLSDGVRPGQKVRVYVHASARFGLPASGETPIIMVGPGTGIAPFRAFLQDRHATNAKGRNWLFFGDQKAAGDFLYQEELEAWQKDGILTRLDLAFSRDQAEKIYVQNRMLENSAELWAWLEQGAHFYVCGDAKRMAADVDAALKKIVADHGGKSPGEADAYVAALAKAGRYQRDVY